MTHKNTLDNGDVYLTAECAAFGEHIREYRISVDADDTVRVWDPVAEYYTTCHSLDAEEVAEFAEFAEGCRDE